jgi:hypothetical protein
MLIETVAPRLFPRERARVDLAKKRIMLISADEGSKDPLCKGSDKIPTAILWGTEDYIKSKTTEKH